jgi:hypothetical protein
MLRGGHRHLVPLAGSHRWDTHIIDARERQDATRIVRAREGFSVFGHLFRCPDSIQPGAAERDLGPLEGLATVDRTPATFRDCS